ncbi:MAG TPA: hypothetical protein VKV79_01470 [Terriglobia bacterium]|nr:hypothetical protein [Terriglobia bacterium]
MDKPDTAKTLGQAIDSIVEALKSLDGSSQLTAIRAACDYLKIQAPEGIQAKPLSSSGPEATQALPRPTISGPVDIRSLKQQKQPSSANEMAALVAFYLSEVAGDNERKAEVEQGDIIKYFKQAGFPLPKAPQVLLANAKNAGYFDFLGGGKFRLNAVGYNLVAHNLPRTQERAPSTAARRPRKSTAAKGRQRAKQRI